MSRILLMAFAPAVVSLLPTLANARPHCHLSVDLSDGSQSIDMLEQWDDRNGGGRWNQTRRTHRDECDDKAEDHFDSLDLYALAKANGMCGTITATGKSWIGTYKRKTNIGPRVIEVACPTTGEDTEESDFQYASKVLCGSPDDHFARTGEYRAVVNIHNPSYDTVAYRYKFATAGDASDGRISPFTDTEIGPDGAQFFDCKRLEPLADSASAFDGFFVIESREPLDVVTYYSAGSDQVATVDVEPTRERRIPPGKEWSCGVQSVNLATAQGWTVNGQPASFVTNGSSIGQATDGVLSDRPAINWQQAAGNYDYRLPFCLCENSQEYDTSAQINITELTIDNSGSAHVDGNTNAFVPGPNAFGSASPIGSGSTMVSGSGNHFLQIQAVNNGSSFGTNTPHEVGISGTMTINNGYLGQCQP